jgi:transketolase
LICVRTVIGFGSPKAGTNAVHGEPLGPEATRETKHALGFPDNGPFYIPEEARRHWAAAIRKGADAQQRWTSQMEGYRRGYSRLGDQYDRTIARRLPDALAAAIPRFSTAKEIATRTAGGAVLNAIADVLPELFGGAADLTTSTKTIFKESPSFHVEPWGRNIFFGVREFAMMAIVNGIAAHGGLIPFGSTFFTFSDYCRSAIRMGALQCSHSLYVFTHDSVGLVQDGPTHQPIEPLMALSR